VSIIARMDHWVDTKEKRYALFCIITLIVGCILLLPYLILAISILNVHQYEDLFTLIYDSWFMPYTFVSRMIVSIQSLTTANLKSIFLVIVQSISVFEMITLAAWIVLLTREEMKWIKRMIIVFMIACIPLGIAAFYTGMHSLSVYELIAVLHMVAIGMGAVSVFMLIGMIVMLVGYYFPKYGKALQYHVVEVKEDE